MQGMREEDRKWKEKVREKGNYSHGITLIDAEH